MKKHLLLAVLFLWVGAVNASAATIELADWGFKLSNENNSISHKDSFRDSFELPGDDNTGLLAFDVLSDGSVVYGPSSERNDEFDWFTGLGHLRISIKSELTDTFNLNSFLDHDIDAPDNTWFNEYGLANGTQNDSQSWEIDEADPDYGGLIFSKAIDPGTGLEDMNNTVDANGNPIPVDVAMAMGWTFSLTPGDTAIIDLYLSETLEGLRELEGLPDIDFYLTQIDDLSGNTVYFSSKSNIETSGPVEPVPEPATLLLLGAGLAGLACGRRKLFEKS